MRKLGRVTVVIILTIILFCNVIPHVGSSNFCSETLESPSGWSVDTRLTNSISPDARPSITSENNNLNIIWRDIWGGDGRIFYQTSLDYGRTWSSAKQLNIGGDGDNPDILDKNEKLHVVYQDNLGVNTDEIIYCNSPDKGVTWTIPKYISIDDAFNSQAPKIAVSDDGQSIHVIWVDSRHNAESAPPNTELYYTRSLDGGNTWEAERRFTNAFYGTGSQSIAVEGNTVHVVWGDGRNGVTTGDVYYKVSYDNGATWQDGLGSIDQDRRLTTNATNHYCRGVAVNGSKIHVIWTDQIWPGPVYTLYYRNSTDNGATWNTIKKLTGPQPIISNAEISIWGDEIDIVWADTRDDGSTSEIYYKNSTNGGMDWNPDLRLTYNEGNDSWMPKIAIDKNMKYIAWYDERDGNAEIYYKRYPDFLADTTPPSIIHTPATGTQIGRSINITAEVSDNVAISGVWLNYTGVNGTNYNISMTGWNVQKVMVSGLGPTLYTQDGNFSFEIPAQNNPGVLSYYIWAEDVYGNIGTHPFGGNHFVQITGPPSIEISNIVGDVDWTGGSNHLIEFTASDTEDDPANLTVFLNYSYNSGTITGTINQTTGDGSPQSWTLPLINATDVKIVATVIDSDGNKAYDDSLEFTIDSSPPEVISTNPVNNTTGISIFQPVVIQFNEPMNISSVVVNQTNGTDPGGWSWFWNEDKDTITGIHNSWSREDVIEMTVQENYSDDSNPGNANNTAYVFSFTTETNPPPEIVHTNISSPQELGDAIRINATITDDGTVMNAVLWWQDVDDVWHENYMDSAVGGNWEFLIPGQMKEGKVRFQINATDDLPQKNTTIIYEFDVEDTTLPVIVHTPVESAIIDEPINITCQVSDLGGVNVVYLYYKNETDMDFMQKEMNPGYWYEIPAHSVPATIEYYLHAFDIYGNDATTQTYSLEIIDPTVPDTIRPEVLLATPTGDDIPISTDISIVFSEAMNQTTVESAISISPTISGIGYNWLDNQTLVIETDNLSYNKTYSVTIDSGAKDLAGNTLANDYSWQFATVEEPEIIDLPAPNDWSWIGIIILLITIIILMLMHWNNRKKNEEKTEESEPPIEKQE